MNAFDIWNTIREKLKAQLSVHVYDRWILPIQPLTLESSILKLQVPDDFFKNWVIDHYSSMIGAASKEAFGDSNVSIIYETASYEETKEPPSQVKMAATIEIRPNPVTVSTNDNLLSQSQSMLNPKYTFESFVVGPSNRFAHAASMAVADALSTAYNPLFIYGPVGLGKTHLMQAIGAQVLRKDPMKKVLYITSEKFTNQLINAIKTGTTIKFRERYRNVDCLLIDDIHFIAGKEATMEEFFHTFNSLYDAHRQIVVSSDKPPKEIHHLEERLVSRFEWGLVTDIQAPDFETRAAILRSKAEREGLVIPESVTSFIADKIKSNIRELEGALIRVVAYSKLVGKHIDEQIAYDVLKDMIVENQRKITVELIQKIVSDYFEIRPTDMASKKRSQNVVLPRHIAMYLSRELTPMSFPEIGEYFGGRDHTTVLHAYEKLKKDIKKDPKVKSVVDKLLSELNR